MCWRSGMSIDDGAGPTGPPAALPVDLQVMIYGRTMISCVLVLWMLYSY